MSSGGPIKEALPKAPIDPRGVLVIGSIISAPFLLASCLHAKKASSLHVGDYTLAGLSYHGNRQVYAKLKELKASASSSELSDSFVRCVNLIASAAKLLMKEYASTQNELDWWRRRDLNPHENNTIINNITDDALKQWFDRFSSSAAAAAAGKSSYINDQVIHEKIAELDSNQRKLARSLAKVKEAAECLKQLYHKSKGVQFASLNELVASDSSSAASAAASGGGGGGGGEEEEIDERASLDEFACVKILACLEGLVGSMREYQCIKPAGSLQLRDDASASQDEMMTVVERKVERKLKEADEIMRGFAFNDDHPLNLAVKGIPSYSWLTRFAIGLGGVLVAWQLRKVEKRQQLLDSLKSLGDSAVTSAGKFYEAILTPLKEFHDDFWDHAHANPAKEEKEKATNAYNEKLKKFYKDYSPAASSRPEPTEEEMKTFFNKEEENLKFSSFAFFKFSDHWNVKLLKCVTEMKEILASNQFLMKLAPVAPAAFGFIFGLPLLLNNVVGPLFFYVGLPFRSAPPKRDIRVRIAFSDVERSLQEVYAQAAAETQGQNSTAVIDRPSRGNTSDIVAKGKLCYHLLTMRRLLTRAFTPVNYFSSAWTLLFGESEFEGSFDSLAMLSHNVDYISILRDLHRLESPDHEVSGSRKIATAERMRVAYSVFLPN